METPRLQAVELPYAGDRLSMIVLLSKQADGLSDIEKVLTGKSLAEWISELREQPVAVALPRFKMASTFRLDQVLISMGMRDAFSRARADFSGLDGARRLFISAVIHQACVDVSEEGTEAAAGAAAVLQKRGRVYKFWADRPFLFVIRDRDSGCLLFVGRVLAPRS
jgi:serpin B